MYRYMCYTVSKSSKHNGTSAETLTNAAIPLHKTIESCKTHEHESIEATPNHLDVEDPPCVRKARTF